MAARSTNTMSEVLQRFLSDIAQAKVLADADLPFLMELETMLIGKIKDPMVQMQDAGILPAGGDPAMGPPQGGGFVGQGTPVGGGVMQGSPMPNPDELRRLVGG